MNDTASGTSSEGEGYLEDLAYLPGFYGNLAPNAIRFTAALNGLMPPPVGQPFDYLELGCGTGMALALLAEANPEGRFVGVDFLAEHVREAERLVAAGGLTNIRFLQRAFGDLGPSDLQRFDFIVMHGVWSWVSAEVRREILQIVQQHLKPGGLVLVSYNALPGWAPRRPIRDMLHAYGANDRGAPLERVEKALKYLVFLRDNGAPYFKENPAASHFVDAIVQLDRRYLAHEYFQDHWAPQSFTDVAEAYAKAGTAFVGSLPAFTNFRDLCAGPEFQEVLASAQNRLILEVHKDLIANTAFRWDVYGTAQPVGADDEPFASFLFTSGRVNQTFPIAVQFGAVKAELAGGIYQTLLQDIAGSTGRSIADLAKLPGVVDMPRAELRRAIGIMVACNLIEVQSRPMPAAVAGALAIPSPLNRLLMAELPGTNGTVALAAQATGTAHPVNHVDAAILLDLATHGRDGLPERVVAWMHKTGRTMQRNETPVPDGEAVPLIAAHCAELQTTIVPRLRRYGIITGG